MATRKRMNADPCPVARALDLVGDRWSLLIVRDAFDGVERFGEFQRSLGVARNILAARLRALVEAQVLELAPAADGGAHQAYRLTARGRALFPVVVGLRQWGEGQLFDAGEPRSRLLAREGGAPLAAMLPRTQDGRVLAPEHTWVEKAVPAN